MIFPLLAIGGVVYATITTANRLAGVVRTFKELAKSEVAEAGFGPGADILITITPTLTVRELVQLERGNESLLARGTARTQHLGTLSNLNGKSK